MPTSSTRRKSALLSVVNVVRTWETSLWQNEGKAYTWREKSFSLSGVSAIVLFVVSCLRLVLSFLTRCNPAPSWLACRRQLGTELCHRGPVLLPRGRGFGPLHQWGLPHGGRHSSDVQAEVQRGRGVKGAEWVRPFFFFIKNSSGVKMSYFFDSQAIVLFSTEKLLLFLADCLTSHSYTVYSASFDT